MIGTNQYIENPHPEKQVKRVHYSIPLSTTCYLTVRQNMSGNLTISIPDTVETKLKLGLFIEAEYANAGDALTATLIGSSTFQPLKINDYTEINSLLGSIEKIEIHLNPAKVGNEQITKITGYTVRFTD